MLRARPKLSIYDDEERLGALNNYISRRLRARYARQREAFRY
jgi:hypothetical protein